MQLLEDHRAIRNGIIATAIGTPIATFILWLIGYLPVVWGWLKRFVTWFYEVSITPITIPLWCMVLLVLVIVFTFIALLRIRSKYKQALSSSQLRSSAMSSQHKREERVEYTPDEIAILKVFALADNESHYLNQLAGAISRNRIRTELAVESLVGKGLVDFGMNYIHGNSYFLTHKGQTQVIELGFA